MKKHVLLLNFLVSVLILISCEQKGNHSSSIFNGEYITINAYNLPFNYEKELKLSEFVENIDIIPLELTEASLLSTNIDRIRIHNDNILMFEKNKDKCIYRFNRDGKFLNQIGKKGQGPHEFIELSDFCIDEKESIVYLLDNARKSVLCYNMNGEFIKNIQIDKGYSRIEYQDELFYVFRDQPSQEGSFSLEIKNMEGKSIAKYFPSKHYRTNHNTPTFHKQKDGLIFYRSKNDTIYKINKDTLSYMYFVDFGSYRLTPEEIEDIYQEKIPTMNILMNKERVTGIDFVYQINDLLFFQTTYKQLTYLYIYNTEKNELTISGGSGLFDDFYYMFFSNNFYGSTQEALLGIYDANYIDQSIKTLDNFEKLGYITTEKKQQLKDKILSYCDIDNNEERNPWVLIYHLKKE